MSEEKLDIEKWKTEYPYLKNIWKFYEEFDKSVDNDDNKNAYNGLCGVIREQEGIEERKHNDFCMKLVRNLGHFADNSKNYRSSPERCQILYHWVYYMTKKYDIPDNFTKQIFDRSNIIISASNISRLCPYYSYKEKIHDPPNIIKIFNLQIVMNELVSILMKDDHENNCSCRKFISECAKIYNDMNSAYCSGVKKDDPENDGTCTHLSTFSNFYEFYINSNQDLKSKLPSLTDGTMKVIIPCESEKSGEELTNLSPEVHKPDNPIKIGTNAVLGTMAGVSSLFALSYKFTPLGKWFRPRNLRGTIESSNIGKQAEYELFHNGPEDENIRLDQTRYNVAYSPV